MNNSQLLKTALASALTLGMASVATLAAAQPAPQMQMSAQQQKMMDYMMKNHLAKCYGINAAYKNDCQTPGNSCAGQDSKSRDPGAFVAVPAGLCAKIDGGSPQPAKA
jgi:uncharacterized membrane protein